MDRGYLKIWRKIEDSGLMQMPNTLALFMFLLLRSTHKTRKIGTPIGVVDLLPGQYISGRTKLAFELEQTEQEIRTGLDRLEKLEILTIKTTSKFSVYTIVNYANYQEQLESSTSTLTSKQPANNQQTTTKQTHNIKERNNNPPSHFEMFWEVWPKSQRKEAKGKCLEVWKRKGLDIQITHILAHLEYCKSNGRWNDPKYIEAPLVYLNQSKWEGVELDAGQTELGNWI